MAPGCCLPLPLQLLCPLLLVVVRLLVLVALQQVQRLQRGW
jgi:hypothetical protein